MKPLITRWNWVPSYCFAFTYARKFSTVFGAASGKSSILILPAVVSSSTWGFAAWTCAPKAANAIAARMDAQRLNMRQLLGVMGHFLGFCAGVGTGTGGLGAVLDGGTAKSSRTSASFVCALLFVLSRLNAWPYSTLARRV